MYGESPCGAKLLNDPVLVAADVLRVVIGSGMRGVDSQAFIIVKCRVGQILLAEKDIQPFVQQLVVQPLRDSAVHRQSALRVSVFEGDEYIIFSAICPHPLRNRFYICNIT